MVAATILIPTHDAPDSLGEAVDSARAQTVRDLEILIIGDGVEGSYRQVIDACVASDERVRFLDLPKGANRGERNRHHGVLAARGPAIVYLGDDDLLLPRHTENMLELLREADLCQSANGYFDRDGRLRLLPAQLAEHRWHRWHLGAEPRNRVSITGTAHTRAAYDRLERGWDLAASGMPTDLTLWRQFFVLDDLRARTHVEMTTLQFPGYERVHMSPDAVRSQQQYWSQFIREPDAHARLQRLAHETALADLAESMDAIADLQLSREALLRDLDSLRRSATAESAAHSEVVGRLCEECDAARTDQLALATELAGLEAEHRSLAGELDATRRTLSWRITAPLRAGRRRWRRDH